LLRDPALTRSSRLDELAGRLGLTEDDVAAELEKLRELGLLTPSWLEGQEYPLDPSVAFERLAARRQREIDDLGDVLRSDQLAAGEFISDYGNFLVQKSARDIEIPEGRERASQRMQHFHPTSSMWGMIQPDADPTVNRESFPDRRHLERGIEMRYLYSESTAKKPGGHEFFDFIFREGGKVRIAPSVPFRMIIFDRQTVVMGIDPEDTSVGAVVHHSAAVVRLAEEFYIDLWNRAADPFEERT